MNIDEPRLWEWILLLCVGGLAAAVNALRSFAKPGTGNELIVGAIAGVTALFTTIASFLILYSVMPVMFGVSIPIPGTIGISGLIAYLGLRKAIRIALTMATIASRK
jgi:hypothetical protein